MDNANREQRSDMAARPLVWYVYMMDVGNDYYVGQTNDLEVRLMEHGTQRPKGVLVWFTQVADRAHAKNLEQRIAKAIDGDKGRALRMVEQFHRLLRVVRPEKTLEELQEEEQARQREIKRSFHLMRMLGSGWQRACDTSHFLTGDGLYGADAKTVAENHRVYSAILDATGDESAALRGAPMGRKSCPPCLAKAQEEIAARGVE